MSTGEPDTLANPTSLLADLETRQDELLRLLAELEARTEQALAALGVKAAGEQAAAPGAAAPALAPLASAGPAEIDAQRSATAATRTTRRKAA